MAILGDKNFWNARQRLPRISGDSVTKELRNKPSKNFVTSNSVAVASGDTEHVTIKSRNAEAEKFAPFSDAIVTNKSDCDIEIWVNQDSDNALFVNAGQTIAFGENEIGGVYSSYSIHVLNGVALSVGDIKVQSFHRGSTAEKSVNKAVRVLGRLF